MELWSYKGGDQKKRNMQSSLTNFLEKIEKLRLFRGNGEQLLCTAAELFIKEELMWLRTNRFTYLNDLVDQMKADSQTYNYGFDLFKEIHKRTQYSNEKITKYCCGKLSNKLGSSKPYENIRVKRI